MTHLEKLLHFIASHPIPRRILAGIVLAGLSALVTLIADAALLDQAIIDALRAALR